jgi:hypothetical protein
VLVERRAAADARARRRRRHETIVAAYCLMSVLASIDSRRSRRDRARRDLRADGGRHRARLRGPAPRQLRYGQLIMAGAYTLAYTSGWPVVAQRPAASPSSWLCRCHGPGRLPAAPHHSPAVMLVRDVRDLVPAAGDGADHRPSRRPARRGR